MNRKKFLKNACVTGACMCGFASVFQAVKGSAETGQSEAGRDDNGKVLIQEWIAQLLSGMDSNLTEENKRAIMKKCAIVHYNNLKMDDVLAGYKGNLEGFMKFLEKEWVISWDSETKILIADENKSYCVCPMVNHGKKLETDVICYCSEGFAEKMFSLVAGTPATATVLASIHRGDKSCRYKVTFK
jgi:hypothetical protein